MSAPEITLANPVEIGGEIVSSIRVRPATDADFAAVYRLNARAEVKAMKLVSRLTGHDWRALAKIEEANAGFLARVDNLIPPPSTES